jgi:hypothetical protein
VTQPFGNVCAILERPDPTPVTTPVVRPTVAIEDEPDDQVPPDGEVPNVVEKVWHTTCEPVNGAGERFTVITGVDTGLLTQPEVEVTVTL